LTMRPSDFEEKPESVISREEAVEELIEKIQKGRRIG